ncbi:MAG: hypothetical protein HS111_16935 [Kofleriaceae bacterium]|nr:hypothetical protein [Kofleriaceae bacterium]MCL4223144.1 hypothetical protein [Myxococcales bacterium]
MLRIGLIVVTTLAAVGGIACGKSHDDAGAILDPRRDHARALVRQVAFEAFPIWATRPSNAGTCPPLSQLAQHLGRRDLRDPWGRDLVVTCSDLPPGAVGIAVSSNGADGKPGTADDIRSWAD